MTKGALVLASGESFSGYCPPSQTTPCFGEVIFNTGMTGYVESLTDPSYAGQILVFTYPLIGNYGVMDPSTWESTRPHVKGVVMSTLTEHYSHYNAKWSLPAWLTEHHIPCLVGVDTRALTIKLREVGSTPGAITPTPHPPLDFEAFEKIHWVKQVAVQEPRYYGEGEKCIIAVDCGMKENMIRRLLRFPVRVKRVPYDYDFSEETFDGVLISNGPGDPIHCQETIRILQKAAQKKKPMFGICLGTQLMALSHGAKVYKLPFGHHSQNQPCIDLHTGRCYLTSQNHGYAIDEKTLPADWQVTFRNLNDGSVEGIEHRVLPFFSVQFHPEASPGPTDTQWLFEKFYNLVSGQSGAPCQNSTKY
jgi:carbamoyl-phosphate synthase small subunit